MTRLKAMIVDASGPVLTSAEEDLFRSEKPAGFILFKRNCFSHQQIKELVAAFRECTGHMISPILIDQEGGSVSRLKAPMFKEYPSARHFSDLIPRVGRDEALKLTTENARLMAEEMRDLGVTVNCAPVLDVPSPGCHAFLAESRTYGNDAEDIAAFGEVICQSFLEAGITPVIKHIPGHGRAEVDSHLALPMTSALPSDLESSDFLPFKKISEREGGRSLWAMAAHVVYTAIDSQEPATTSVRIVKEIIRGYMGFEGVLLADDISMKALQGTIESRVQATLGAGMDLTMICNAPFEDRVKALTACPYLTEAAEHRLAVAEQNRRKFQDA